MPGAERAYAQRVWLRTLGVIVSVEEPPKKVEPKSESLWPAVLFWGGLVLVLFIAGVLDKESSGAGRTFFGWVVGAAAVAFFVWLVWGKTVKDTASNVTAIVKGVVVLIVVSLVLGGLFKCAGISPSEDIRDTGGVPNQWRR